MYVILSCQETHNVRLLGLSEDFHVSIVKVHFPLHNHRVSDLLGKA